MMWQRCLTAFLGIPLAIFLVYLGGIPFCIVVTIISLLGIHEFFNILLPSKVGLMRYYAYFSGVVWQAATFFQMNIIPQLLIFLFLFGLILYIINYNKLRLQDFTLAVLGVVYVFGLFNYLILMRLFTPNGKWWVFLGLILIWSNDVGAFFIGRGFGRHKLHELVSPKKTIEGALGGIFLTIFITSMINIAFGFMLFSQSVLLSILVSVLCIFGDLWESGLKRIAGVKDSGSLLPGHGGILDRFDSLLFAVPVMYYYLHGFIIN